jgi:hypothetical protein
MQKWLVLIGAALLAGLLTWQSVRNKKSPTESPHRAVVLVEDTHDELGIARLESISIVNRDTIQTLESFFPNYRSLPGSDIAGGWKAGIHVYFDFPLGRTIRVTVAKNDDGKTWSVGHGDFRTQGDFEKFVNDLKTARKPQTKGTETTGSLRQD